MRPGSWYDRLMVFKPLGHDKFDTQVMLVVQMDPDQMLKVTFSSEDYDKKPSTLFGNSDLHGKNINILHLACQEGLLKTAAYILEQDLNQLNFKSASGWTPFMTAAEASQTEMIDLLIEKAGSHRLPMLNYLCQSGSPMHAACTG